MSPNQSTVDFASLITRPVTQRWPNLEAYGIQFKIAVYQDGSDHIFVAGDPSQDEKLQQLGFSKIGDEWTLPGVKLIPREILRVFPEMVMDNEMLASRIFEDRTEFASQQARVEAVADNDLGSPRM